MLSFSLCCHAPNVHFCTLSDLVAPVPAVWPAAGTSHSIMASVVVIVATNNRAPPSSLSQDEPSILASLISC